MDSEQAQGCMTAALGSTEEHGYKFFKQIFWHSHRSNYCKFENASLRTGD